MKFIKLVVKCFIVLGMIVATAVLFGISWLACSVLLGSIDAQLMRFESVPKEGWDYWWWDAFYGHMPIMILMSFVLGGPWLFLLWFWYLLIRELLNLIKPA